MTNWPVVGWCSIEVRIIDGSALRDATACVFKCPYENERATAQEALWLVFVVIETVFSRLQWEVSNNIFSRVCARLRSQDVATITHASASRLQALLRRLVLNRRTSQRRYLMLRAREQWTEQRWTSLLQRILKNKCWSRVVYTREWENGRVQSNMWMVVGAIGSGYEVDLNHDMKALLLKSLCKCVS